MHSQSCITDSVPILPSTEYSLNSLHYCNRTDDIVDSPRALLNREVLRHDLSEWSARLDATWAGQPADLFDLALADTVRQYPTLSKAPFQDMIKGMVMDVPGDFGDAC